MSDLRQLMAAYFHQDFDLEHGTDDWEPVVDLFIRTESHRIPGVIRELDELLDAPDTDLSTHLGGLGNYYWPGDEPGATRTWLIAIRDRLSAASGHGTE